MLKLHNTLSRQAEDIKPISDKKIGLYACGPTVYNFAHIGNLRTYVFEDVLRRVLEYDGYQVSHAMNITDVGHLVSDADEGEDKMEVGAKREGKPPLEIAKQYESAFFEDLKKLNILPPTKLLRATESIKEQVEIIKLLEDKGFTYKDESAIYFDTSKYQGYGKLAGQKLEDKKIGARAEVVVDKRKKNPADFALWFFLSGRYKNHVLRWPSPWGEGFPGWHIECSAISRKLLGQPFDIHAGGVDHIGTHHTNEMAQSEAAYGMPLANYWVHGEFLQINEGKMAKSGGNFMTLQDLVDRGYSPLAYRYFTFGAHYRSRLNFTWEALDSAQNALDSLYQRISELKGQPRKFACADYIKTFEREINNDLDMPRVLSLTWRLIKSDVDDGLKQKTLEQFDRVLGLDLLKGAEASKDIPPEIKELDKKRLEYREEKNFTAADEIRKKMNIMGASVSDTAEGSVISIRSSRQNTKKQNNHEPEDIEETRFTNGSVKP